MHVTRIQCQKLLNRLKNQINPLTQTKPDQKSQRWKQHRFIYFFKKVLESGRQSWSLRFPTRLRNCPEVLIALHSTVHCSFKCQRPQLGSHKSSQGIPHVLYEEVHDEPEDFLSRKRSSDFLIMAGIMRVCLTVW